MRLDKFLKVSRLIKRRELAKQIIDMGLVNLNGKLAKPSSEVNILDKIEIKSPNGKVILAEVLDIKSYSKIEDANKMYRLIELEEK